MNNDKTSPFLILGVPETATIAEIKTAYRKLCLKHHPDISGGKSDMFIKICDAYKLAINIKNNPNSRSSFVPNKSSATHAHRWHVKYTASPFTHSDYRQANKASDPETLGNIMDELFGDVIAREAARRKSK